MTEEKKEETRKEEAPKKVEKASKPAGSPDSKPRHVKISKMTLAQVEEAIERTQKQMGGPHSSYALSLAARRDSLKRGGPKGLPEAA